MIRSEPAQAEIGHNGADERLRSFVDRILRCREAEDAAKEDTKAVYAELKGEGYDKAATGALVAELRKQDKNPDKFNEAGALLDLYREAYQRASGTPLATHVHTRATEPHSQQADSLPEAADMAEAETPPSASAAPYPVKTVVLRPHCLRPELCAGSGRQHCHACTKAMATAEEPA